MGLSEIVMRLREVYPHPANRGLPRTRPSPQAVEGWLGEALRLGRLSPDDLPRVVEGAERVRRLAEEHPEAWRRALRTWIREAGWEEEIEEEETGPVLPPPSSAPRFTPRDWNESKFDLSKEKHDRLDDGR